MTFTLVACAFFAFAVLIMGAALAHHLDDTEYDPWDDDDDPPLCEDECNVDGPQGECSKCGWFDHLAQHKADKGD